jgi:predicted nucleotidyltransferase
MRLTEEQTVAIRRIVGEEAGDDCVVRVFGSRLDDAARGGDVDLLVQANHAVERPALLAARLSARLSRALRGRRVDVLLAAPNLAVLPIHTIAERDGVRL